VGRFHDDAKFAGAMLGNASQSLTPLGFIGPIGQWLGWPDWMFEGTSVNVDMPIPQSLPVSEDLMVIANLLERGVGGMLIDRAVDSKRLAAGPIGALISRNAPNLRDALQLLSIQASSTNVFLKLQRVRNEDRVAYVLEGRVKLGSLMDFYAAKTAILFLRTIERYKHDGFAGCQIALAGPIDSIGGRIVEEWGEFVTTAAGENRISFPASWEDLENPDYDLGLWLMARSLVEANQKEATAANTYHEVRQRVLATLRKERRVPRLKEIAAVDGTSVRTFNRRLSRAGIKYQEIVNDARRSVISALITQQSIPFADIAESSGFSDISSFSRSFRMWFGKSPRGFRSSLRK